MSNKGEAVLRNLNLEALLVNCNNSVSSNVISNMSSPEFPIFFVRTLNSAGPQTPVYATEHVIIKTL